MTVDITIEKNFPEKHETDDPEFSVQEIADRVLLIVMDELKCPYEAQVNLLLTDDGAIHEINLEMRNIDRSTDVLSFPMTQYEMPGEFGQLEEDFSAFDPDSGELLLGDIVISVDHVLKQAEEYGHSVLREYAFLMVHSLLHLTGYDHMESADAAMMEERQRVIMDKLGISR